MDCITQNKANRVRNCPKIATLTLYSLYFYGFISKVFACFVKKSHFA